MRLYVFPAYAGVFLGGLLPQMHLGGLPRIRGGVSGLIDLWGQMWLSSPHTRGCFLLALDSIIEESVFPAYAGVFLGD